jgi:hypothetical protein
VILQPIDKLNRQPALHYRALGSVAGGRGFIC